MLKFIESGVVANERSFKVHYQNYNENVDNCIWKGHQIQIGNFCRRLVAICQTKDYTCALQGEKF